MLKSNLNHSSSGLTDSSSQGNSILALGNTFFDHIKVAICTCDKNGYIVAYNEAAIELWGRAPEVNKDLWCGSWRMFTPEGLLIDLANYPMACCLKGAKIIDGEEIIIQCPDGVLKNVKVYLKPLFNNKGEITGAINTLIEITDQKTYDTKQAILASIIQSSDDAIISKTLKGIITSWNNGAKKIFGYSEEEVLGKPIEILIPEERLSEEQKILEELKKGNRVSHFETIRVAKGGKRLPISLTISPVKDSSGRVIGASKIARDISSQKEIEETRIHHAKRLEILNSIGKMVSEKLDEGDVLQKIIDATTKITGAQFGICYSNVYDFNAFFSKSDEFDHDIQDLLNGDGAFFNPKNKNETVIRSADLTKEANYHPDQFLLGIPKQILPVSSYLFIPIVSKSENFLGGLFFGHVQANVFNAEHESIVISIASQAAVALDNAKLFQEVKSLSEKKDQFIARASHEIKTPLTSIHGYLQIIARDINEGKAKLFLDKTLNQLTKLNLLIEALFDLSKISAHKLQLKMVQIDLKEMLDEVIETYQMGNHLTHCILFENYPENVIVNGDRQRLEQVVNNLINNAIKYAPSTTQIVITLEAKENEAIVHVRDFGMGISEAQQDQIFGQFYRVDGLSANISGLGLGLHISKEIIDCHNGKIWVKSELGIGSQFSFSLPY